MTTALRADCSCCVLTLGRCFSARPGAAVRTDVVGRRPRDRQRRRVGRVRRRRHRVLQLHRLRALRAAAAAARPDRGGEGRPITSRCSASCGPRTSTASSRTRCTCASGRGPTRDFDIQVGRVPPTFGAFARRTYAIDNPLIGYPLAYQYLTSLRPTRCPRTPTSCCRCAAAAGCPAIRSATRRSTTACRSSARSAGTPASRSTRSSRRTLERDRVGDDRHAVQSAVPRRQRRQAGRRPRGSARRSPGLILGASAAHGPFVSTRRPTRRWPSATGDDGDFTQNGVGRRRRVLARLLPGALRSHRQRVAPAVRERAGASRCRCARCPRSSKAATRSGRACTPRPASIISASATIDGQRRRRDRGTRR